MGPLDGSCRSVAFGAVAIVSAAACSGPTPAATPRTPDAGVDEARRTVVVERDDPLGKRWLDASNEITPDRLRLLSNLAAADPEAAALLREATQRLGGGALDRLAARFRSCAARSKWDGGHAEPVGGTYFFVRPLEELAFGHRSPEWEAKIIEFHAQPALGFRAIAHPDLVEHQIWRLPNICIQPDLSIRAAYGAVLHQLFRGLRFNPLDEWQLFKASSDENAFLVAVLQLPGNELQAYAFEAQASGHLLGAAAATTATRLFDSNGRQRLPLAQLVDFARAAPPRGLGYGRGRWARLRGLFVEALRAERLALAQFLPDRRQELAGLARNRDIHLQRIAAFKQQMQLARRRGDLALLATAESELADAEQNRSRTEALLAVGVPTERRFEARMIELDAEIAERTPQLGAVSP
jgi:hypothetical protein